MSTTKSMRSVNLSRTKTLKPKSKKTKVEDSDILSSIDNLSHTKSTKSKQLKLTPTKTKKKVFDEKDSDILSTFSSARKLFPDKTSNSEKQRVIFADFLTKIPLNTRISYTIYKSYFDKKTKEVKTELTCKSAFFHGCTAITVLGKTIPALKIRYGKYTTILTEDLFKEIFVYIDQPFSGKSSIEVEGKLYRFRKKRAVSLEHGAIIDKLFGKGDAKKLVKKRKSKSLIH